MMALALSYHEQGAGAPLVILHGLFGSTRNWSAIAARLATTHHVYALDLRNHGASPWADSMSYRELADDVAGFIEHHGLGETVVLGHSMGGKAAMLLALGHAHLIAALIVVDIAPVRYEQSLSSYVQAMQGLNLSGLSRRDDADEALRDDVPELGVRMFLLQNLVYKNKQFDWRINLPALAANMGELADFPTIATARSYDGKALFLYGARSVYRQPAHDQVVRRLFPRAEIVVIPGAGHWLHVDQPERLTEEVRRFLDNHSG
ncbi:MAG: alpha/beta fold hydrolase [Gammaproteobacteria bacterium]|nr:MAG: alpha/beta fold hydrolase [Gammaproteobacteria bacterium]